MKKQYIAPEFKLVDMRFDEFLLAASNDHGKHGRDNACEHGDHWFCDD
jgi:hypothetical protein